MPDLNWVVIPYEQMKSALEGIGMAKQIAAGLVEMNAGMHQRVLHHGDTKTRLHFQC